MRRIDSNNEQSNANDQKDDAEDALRVHIAGQCKPNAGAD
jgi:hypothetical protein